MDRELTSAQYGATLVTRALQEALNTSDELTALLLIPMIADSAKLAQQIGMLLHAQSMRSQGS